MANNMRYSQPEEIPGAMEDVRRWGYVRPLTEIDRYQSAWLCIDEGAGWLWFQWVPGEDRLAAVHIAIAPEHRGRGLSPRLFEGGRWFAEFMGAKEAIAMVDPQSTIGRMLKRRGWVESDNGLRFRL